MRFVELHDLSRRQPQPQSDHNDPAGGRAGDEVEVLDTPLSRRLFKSRQRRRAERPFDPATIQSARMVVIGASPLTSVGNYIVFGSGTVNDARPRQPDAALRRDVPLLSVGAARVGF
jgi:hypothetical protein